MAVAMKVNFDVLNVKSETKLALQIPLVKMSNF